MAKTVLKDISKLNKVPHPRSRKAAQITKKAIRSTAREKSKKANFMKQNILGEKLMWFKEKLELVDEVTPSTMLGLILRYLARFDEELKQIQIKHSIKHRKGRQHASREDVIKMTKSHELNEFKTCGIEIPDLFDANQLALLKNWTGELRFLQNFKIVRYNRSSLENLIKMNENGRKGEMEDKSEMDVTPEGEPATVQVLETDCK